MDSEKSKIGATPPSSGGLRRNGFSFDSLTGVFGMENRTASILDFAGESDHQDWSSLDTTTEQVKLPTLSTQVSALQGADAAGSNESVASCTSVASLSSKSDVGPSTSTGRHRRFSAPSRENATTDVSSLVINVDENRQRLHGADINKQKYMLNWLYRPVHTLAGGISEEADDGLSMAPSAGPITDAVISMSDKNLPPIIRRPRAGSDKGARERNLCAPSNW